MIHVHVDCETFSRADIRTVGGHQYARDPSTECLMVAYQVDDPEFGPGPLQLWDIAGGTRADLVMPADLWAYLKDPEVVFCAFNAAFEMAIFEHCLNVKFDPARWICVQALALSYGLPGSLGGVCDAMGFGTEYAKKDGDKLIRRFSIPQPKDGRRIMPSDDPAGWTQFGDYCKQDVVAEREIYRRLTK